MVTKYDIFEFIYTEGDFVKPNDIVKYLKKPRSTYHAIYQMLLELEKDGLIHKSRQGFQVIRSKKNALLFHLIKFCIANGINYNNLIDENIAKFINKAVRKDRFSIRDFRINSRTFSKYLEMLSRSGLLITISKKPLVATIVYNTFIHDFLAYFNYRDSKIKQKADEYISEIKAELDRFKKMRKKNERKYQEIIDRYEIQFIQHSLNLEGNPITLPETIKLLKDKIVPKDINLEMIQEVQNYQQAVKQMIKDSENKNPLTKTSILNYHYIAMQHKQQIGGKIREVHVFIKNNPDFKLAKPDEIEKKLDALLDKYNTFINKKGHSLKEILNFDVYFHNEFQHIHPFVDGNSRLARLLTFHLLRSYDIPVIDIPLGLLEKYLSSTKGAKKRDDTTLNRVIQLIILYNLKTINEQLQ